MVGMSNGARRRKARFHARCLLFQNTEAAMKFMEAFRKLIEARDNPTYLAYARYYDAKPEVLKDRPKN